MAKERSYRTAAGRELLLRSKRGVSEDGNSWTLELKLYRVGRLGKRLLEERSSLKSGSWPLSAVELLQAQAELEMLRDAGVELSITEL